MSAVSSPFKFLDSYQREDLDIFFGRERETENLYDALSGVKHLLVYGPSGSGKTSLIECGLRNRFSDADWYALSIRRGANMTTSVFARINEALRRKIQLDPDTKLPANPDIDFGHAVEQLFDERYKPVYLLFDQFEELLISGDDAEKRDFFTRLDRLIRYKVPCRVLLVMREEFIGHLSEFEPLCPSIFQHRFRLEKMGRAGVYEVIEMILTAPHYSAFFTAPAPEALAGKILTKLPDQQREIELTHVQVFLSELWDRAQESQASALPELHAGLVREEDNLEGVLNGFLRNQLRELDAAYGPNTALEVLAAMISERHTKLQVDEAALAVALEKNNITLAHPMPELLRDLERRRILRTLKSGEQTQYEISHDVLARVVGQNLTEEMKLRERAREVYRVYEGRTGLFSREDLDYLRGFEGFLAAPEGLKGRMVESENSIFERLEAEKMEIERRRRKAMWAALVAGMLILLAVWALVFAVQSLKKANNEEAKAKDATSKSIEYAQIAENKTQKAILDSLKAAIKTLEADSLADWAEVKKLEALKAEYKAKMLLEASRYLATKKLPDNFDVFYFNDTLNFSGWGINQLPREIGNLQNLKSLDLSNNSIRILPVEIGKLQNLRSLDLSRNAGIRLPVEFGNLHNLQSLNLRRNHLSTLPAEIGNLYNLLSLDLGETELSNLTAKIGNLQCLQSLCLDRNQLETLPVEIGNLQKLQWLDLTQNQLNSLPPEIGKIQKLQFLNLTENRLSSLPSEIGKLHNLKVLYLNNNILDSLPSEIGKLERLQSLGLGRNQLETLPVEIGNLRNLQWLTLSENNFRNMLPIEITRLHSLKTLHLNDNYSKTVPAEIGNLHNLETLDLTSNQLRSLPSEIGKLHNIQSLYLSSNLLDSLPTEIGNLQNLQYLFLTSNGLNGLPTEIGNLQNLRSLKLEYNDLISLPAEIGNLHNLQSLDLSQNKLENLPAEIGNLQNLQSLGLWNNQLSSLPKEIIKLQKLPYLNLEKNKFSSLPIEILKQMSNLKRLVLKSSIFGNPIQTEDIEALRLAMPWCEIIWD